VKGAVSGVAAATWGPGRLDLFWRADNGELMHRAQVRGHWLEPESLGGTLASNPAATAWGGAGRGLMSFTPSMFSSL
jgi:hypothetical protein